MKSPALGQMLVGELMASAALRFPDQEAFHCVPTGRVERHEEEA